MTHLPQSISCPRCSSVNPGEANFCRRCGIGIRRPVLKPTPVVSRTVVRTKKPSYAFWPFLLMAIFVLRLINVHHYTRPPTPQLRYDVPSIRSTPSLPTYTPGRPAQEYSWNRNRSRSSPYSSDNPWHLENRNGSGSGPTGY